MSVELNPAHRASQGMRPTINWLHAAISSSTASLEKFVQPHVRPLAELAERRTRKIEIILAVMTVGYIIAAIYYYWQAVYLARGYPHNTFLCVPWERFTDYDNMILMCRNLNPYHDHSRSSYPPLGSLYYYPFSKLSIQTGFAVFVAIPVLFLVLIIAWVLKSTPRFYRWATIVALLFSYPFLFAVDRGNSELWIMMSLGVFFLLYSSPKPWLRDVSGLALAIAIAFKFYPAPLLLISFKDRRYLDCAKTVLLAGLLTLFAAAFFQGGAAKALHDFREVLSATAEWAKDSVKHGANNLGVFYAVMIVLKKMNLESTSQVFMEKFWMLSLMLLGGYSLLIAKAQLSLWASATCLVILACLVPSISYDYRMVQLLVPLLLMLTVRTPCTAWHAVICILFGLLLVPKNYWLLFPEIPPGDVGIASVINPLLLFVLLNVILFSEGAFKLQLRHRVPVN